MEKIDFVEVDLSCTPEKKITVSLGIFFVCFFCCSFFLAANSLKFKSVLRKVDGVGLV